MTEPGPAVVSLLLAADQTYLSLARMMVTGTFPGPVTREFGNMLEKSLAGASSTAAPNWNHNHNALFLVDILCRAAFLLPAPSGSAHRETLAVFRALHAWLVARAEASSRGLLSWVSGGMSRGGGGASLLAAASLPQFPWLAYFVLQAEDLWWREAGG